MVCQVLLDVQQKLRVLDPFAGKEVETMDLAKVRCDATDRIVVGCCRPAVSHAKPPAMTWALP